MLLFYFSTDITAFIIDLAPLTFFPYRWQEAAYHILLVLVLSVPIAAFAQRYSAYFGALASIVGDVLLLYYWLQLPSSRPELGINYLADSAISAGTMALSSHLWWVYAFKHRVARPIG